MLLNFVKKHRIVLGAIVAGTISVALLYRTNINAFLSLAYETGKVGRLGYMTVTVNGVPIKVLVDSGASILAIKKPDSDKVFAGKTPKRQAHATTSAGRVAEDIYDVTVQLPDGAAFTTEATSIPVPGNNLIGMQELTQIYNVEFTPTGINLNPHASTTSAPAAPETPAEAAPAEPKQSKKSKKSTKGKLAIAYI